MAFDQTYTPSTDTELTLVDIEELRQMLGAEANILDDNDTAVLPTCPGTSTCMCPKWF